jgi:hypothetical protein
VAQTHLSVPAFTVGGELITTGTVMNFGAHVAVTNPSFTCAVYVPADAAK